VIPVLTIPVINRPDFLRACLASIDEPVERLIVIDNSGTGELGDVATDVRPDAMIVDPPSNLGVAASWNLAIKTTDAPWWCIANADMTFGAGDLARLAEQMIGARWVGINGDWRAFGLTSRAVERVGLFDESFHPIYCEDADYEYRCDLAGVERYFIDGGATHEGSAAIHSGFAEANARTYPSNLDYYERKWGGHLRGGERFTTPFNRGGSVADWTLDLSRLRSQAWVAS
jgi:GT2 family glycosyltransferase